MLQNYKLIPNSPNFRMQNIKILQICTSSAAISYKKPIKRSFLEPVLNTFGTMLNRDNECFVVSNLRGRQSVPVEDFSPIASSFTTTYRLTHWRY